MLVLPVTGEGHPAGDHNSDPGGPVEQRHYQPGRSRQVLEVVQDEQLLPVPERLHQGRSGRVGVVDTTPTAAHTSAATSSGSVSRARSTKTHPSSYSAPTRDASSSASRVFPVPAGPVNVTHRTPSSQQPDQPLEVRVRPTKAHRPGPPWCRTVGRPGGVGATRGAGRAPAGPRAVGVGGAGPDPGGDHAGVQPRVVPQDRLLEPAQRRRGFDAELVDQGLRPSRYTRSASLWRSHRYSASIS